ncbi:MAG: hypothetical protein P8M30_08565 [Planctomycetaceae bacterium]|nr:hypothetical protein [Planctomycetaceae bacterium]
MTDSNQVNSGMHLEKREWFVIAFTFLYLAIAVFAAIRKNSTEFILYIGVLFILLAVVGLVHFRVRLKISALWGLSIWGLAHMMGGLLTIPESWPRLGESNVLYNLWVIPDWLKFDQLVHAYGFGLVTWICWQGVQRAFLLNGLRVTPSLGLMTLCVAAGMGFGALNEVVEFIASLTLPETNVGGYENTGWDLVFNLLGSLLAAIIISLQNPATDQVLETVSPDAQ